MRVFGKNLKKPVRIKPESLDDLWNLKHMLESGDLISARTIRTIESDKKEKNPMFLKIKLEKVKFDEEGGVLLLHGIVIEGPDNTSFGHHTLRVEPMGEFTVEKKWKLYQINRLKKSVRKKEVKVLICVIDEREADFAFVQERGIKEIGSIRGGGIKKMFYAGDEKKFYADVIKALNEYINRVDKIIVAGPGFTKENLYREIKEPLKQKILLASSSVTGKTGIYEVIRRGVIDKVIENSELSIQTNLMEKFLEHLAKEDGMVAYGPEEIKKANDYAAISELLILDRLVRNEENERLMGAVENNRGVVHIINSAYESGEQLENFGGVAAFLRYRIK